MEIVNPLLAHALDLLKRGHAESAEAAFAEAASACCEAHGEIDIVTARTLAHVARVSCLRGKRDFALQVYERILRIHEALPAPSNSDHAIVLSELAQIHHERGSQGEAQILRRRADDIMEELGCRFRASAGRETKEAAAAPEGGQTCSDDTSGDEEEEDISDEEDEEGGNDKKSDSENEDDQNEAANASGQQPD